MSRNEDILQSIINGESLEDYRPQSRMEALLLMLGKNASGNSNSATGQNLTFDFSDGKTTPTGEIVGVLNFANTSQGWVAPFDISDIDKFPGLFYIGNGFNTHFIVPVVALEMKVQDQTVIFPYLSYMTATLDGILYLSAFDGNTGPVVQLQIINLNGEDITSSVFGSYQNLYVIKL